MRIARIGPVKTPDTMVRPDDDVLVPFGA